MWYAWLEAQRQFARSLGIVLPAAMPEPAQQPVFADAARAASAASSAAPAPPFDIRGLRVDGRPVEVDETVIDRVPICALRRFARMPPSPADRPPVATFVCAPLAGHHAVMLRETVEMLLQDGDVYITDWADARDVPLEAGLLGLDDYVLAVERFLSAAASHAQQMHVVAVCQATVPTLAACALLADEGGKSPARSLTLMGGPIDARLNPTAIDRFAKAHSLAWFRALAIDVIPPPYAGAGRRVYPGFIQHAAIVAAHPERQWSLGARYWSSCFSGDDNAIAKARRALEAYCAVLDMPERYFLDTITVIFHEQQLARGTWHVGTRAVRPQSLQQMALCTVEGDRDDITGAEQTHAAHALCGSIPVARRCRLTIDDCDHYDLFTGPRWRTAVHPALVAFWKSLDGEALPNGTAGRSPRRRTRQPRHTGHVA